MHFRHYTKGVLLLGLPVLLSACQLFGPEPRGPLGQLPEELFGDAYTLFLGEPLNVGDDTACAPHLDGDTLVAWVSFGGCSVGTFTLSETYVDQTAYLAIHHDYPVPPDGIDCERLNFRRLRLAVSSKAITYGQFGKGLLLLNPNPEADPYKDAIPLAVLVLQ